MPLTSANAGPSIRVGEGRPRSRHTSFETRRWIRNTASDTTIAEDAEVSLRGLVPKGHDRKRTSHLVRRALHARRIVRNLIIEPDKAQRLIKSQPVRVCHASEI